MKFLNWFKIMSTFAAKQKTQMVTSNLQKTHKYFGGKITLVVVALGWLCSTKAISSAAML